MLSFNLFFPAVTGFTLTIDITYRLRPTNFVWNWYMLYRVLHVLFIPKNKSDCDLIILDPICPYTKNKEHLEPLTA